MAKNSSCEEVLFCIDTELANATLVDYQENEGYQTTLAQIEEQLKKSGEKKSRLYNASS